MIRLGHQWSGHAPPTGIRLSTRLTVRIVALIGVSIALSLTVPLGQVLARPSGYYSPDVGSEHADTIKAAELVISSQPPGAQVFFDGKESGLTPLTVRDAGEGLHHVVLLHEGYLSIADTITLGKSGVAVRQYSMRRPGRLSVTSTPDSARVFLGDSLFGFTPLEISDLPPGSVMLTVTKHLYLKWEQNITIGEGRQTSVVAKLVSATGYLTLQVAPENSQVFIDGRQVGIGSLDDLELAAGKYSLLLVNPEPGDSLRRDVFIPGGAHLRLGAKLNQASAWPVVMSAVVPGLGQMTAGAGLEGVAYLAGFVGGVALTVAADESYHETQNTYDEKYAKYQAQRIESGANQYREEASAAYDDLRRANTLRTVSFVATVLVYAGSLVDVILNHSHYSEIVSVAEGEHAVVRPSLTLAPGQVRLGIRVGL
jgi:hypothetical protein